MKYKWNEMTNYEKNKLISNKILGLECFSTTKGRQWYDKHYKLGNWHYTTNTQDTFYLLKRVIMENLKMVIIYSNQEYQCQISDKNEFFIILAEAKSNSLSESICLAILLYKKINFEI